MNSTAEIGWCPSTDVIRYQPERHPLYPRRPNRWSTDRGYNGLGNTVLPESALSLLRRAFPAGTAGEEWQQSWPSASLVSRLWQENRPDLRHSLLRPEFGSGHFRPGDPRAGRRKFAPQHRADCPNR